MGAEFLSISRRLPRRRAATDLPQPTQRPVAELARSVLSGFNRDGSQVTLRCPDYLSRSPLRFVGRFTAS